MHINQNTRWSTSFTMHKHNVSQQNTYTRCHYTITMQNVLDIFLILFLLVNSLYPRKKRGLGALFHHAWSFVKKIGGFVGRKIGNAAKRIFHKFKCLFFCNDHHHPINNHNYHNYHNNQNYPNNHNYHIDEGEETQINMILKACLHSSKNWFSVHWLLISWFYTKF